MPFIATEEMCFSTYFTIKSEICSNKTVTHPLYSIRFNTHLLYTFCGMAYDKIESPCLPMLKNGVDLEKIYSVPFSGKHNKTKTKY